MSKIWLCVYDYYMVLVIFMYTGLRIRKGRLTSFRGTKIYRKMTNMRY